MSAADTQGRVSGKAAGPALAAYPLDVTGLLETNWPCPATRRVVVPQCTQTTSKSCGGACGSGTNGAMKLRSHRGHVSFGNIVMLR